MRHKMGLIVNVCGDASLGAVSPSHNDSMLYDWDKQIVCNDYGSRNIRTFLIG